ncbi:hypothetical protein [Roseateles terrae]|uniref:HK97 gp10 family phage protein n=1 Tax=Roseateles terrae TaxID=431060 RepID=A0ABR6GPA6_9BURK|nr:hypothetical protein [Roseateles terrae]MBB3193938.1 hypothetical protein [Roseateles terrae]OWQ87816.1 hypothetical protein CDN98_06530 [Roseateles terrae]
MASKVKVTNKLPQFTADRQNQAARAITQALVLGASEASVLTPIDTSTLLNSQFKNVRVEGDKVVGTVGYTAAYALPVHDPSNPQNFRRATAEKEFLKKGFERAAPNIDAVMKKVMKA